MLVVATSGTGFVLGSGNAIDFAGLCWTCTGTMMVAASANSLNQVLYKFSQRFFFSFSSFRSSLFILLNFS